MTLAIRRRRGARVHLLTAALLAGATPGTALSQSTITTPEIAAAATTFACMQWRISGVCFWLRCSISCSVETSIRVSHFSPDLVVTAYSPLGESPWLEIRALYGAAQVAANRAAYAAQGIDPEIGPAGGNFVEPAPNEAIHKNTIFKDAEVIGGPVNIAAVAAAAGVPLFCPMTAAAPLFPYFLSGLDTLAWRSAATEAIYPATWVPGMREIGLFPLNTWGSVHPRQGFVVQAEDPKAGAVIAQRAADIATRDAQPHVYVPVGSIAGGSSVGMKIWEPGPVVENDAENSRWQMLVPERVADCEVFGANDTLDIFAGWASGKVDRSADYAWNLWRPYQCCADRGTFLFAVEL